MEKSLIQGRIEREPRPAGHLDRAANLVVRHILGLLVLGLLVMTLLPFAAPVLMAAGLEAPARLLYWFYGFTCHQLPQRSWFLFGPKLTYTLAEIQAVWPAHSTMQLREFIGTPDMGWKVAWSDRMLSWYTMTAIWGAVYWLLCRARLTVKPLRWSLLALALAPLVLDGLSHMLNDILAGMSGTGFRDTNAWLRVLTANALPGFYAGDQFGTFNWWARLLTGVVAAWAFAFAFFPRLDSTFQDASTMNTTMMTEGTK